MNFIRKAATGKLSCFLTKTQLIYYIRTHSFSIVHYETNHTAYNIHLKAVITYKQLIIYKGM